MNVTIETERLIIRPWIESDAVDALPVWGDPEVRRYTGGAWNAERMREGVTRRIEAQTRGELFLQPVIEKSTGAFIGASGLQPLAGGPEIEIGWMLALSVWGKGYATEMSRAVLDHGLEELKLPRILATIDQRNVRSIAVVDRLGMRFWKIMHVYERDMLVYEAAR